MMNPQDQFDVYCYVEEMHGTTCTPLFLSRITFLIISNIQLIGEVFHDPVPQQLSFQGARSHCRAARAQLASTAQLYLAWSEGLDNCSPGWLSDGSVRYPIRTPRERCGGRQAGVKTVYRFINQTVFPEPSSLYDVYCFRGACGPKDGTKTCIVATMTTPKTFEYFLRWENPKHLILQKLTFGNQVKQTGIMKV